MNIELQGFLENGDIDGGRKMAEKIVRHIAGGDIDSSSLSDSYYFLGVYNYFAGNIEVSLANFKLSAGIRESKGLVDHRYAKALYNIGTLYDRLGDFRSHEDYSVRSIEVEKKIFGNKSPFLISTYLSLITAYIGLQEYEKALSYANIAINIATNSMDQESPETGILYANMGVLYMFLADYSKARIYLEKSETIFRKSNESPESYVNLLNSLAITNAELGLDDLSREYYEKGISIAVSINSAFAYNLISSYAIELGNTGDIERGVAILRQTLQNLEKKDGKNSRNYFLMLAKYADYLRAFGIDNNESVRCYEECMGYLKTNPHDHLLMDLIFSGYAKSLNEDGRYKSAIELVNQLLSGKLTEEEPADIKALYMNPGNILEKSDEESLSLLRIKYSILCNIYSSAADMQALEAASATSELIVAMLEKIRINISEEASRLFLGDKYRESYINAIRDFNLLYKLTSEKRYLQKAFIYSEKSKVAGLLASTRELKAVQFHIPAEIADLEKKLQREIGLFNARISEESEKENPDSELIGNWKENLVTATLRRDSVVDVLEKEYPGYYSIKYNTEVIELNDIPGIIGRNQNYINYIVSDTVLYIFVANRKEQQLLSVNIDSSFFLNIKRFKQLLSYPSPSDNARLTFEEFRATGYYLYLHLIEPVTPYLISDKLRISPDNILSFIPFETILVSPESEGEIMYRNLDYLMRHYDISYAYSATFLQESSGQSRWKSNKLIAFAPNYSEPVDIRSVMNRQVETDYLPDLPYARLEAEYVCQVTKGLLFENGEAQETVYKSNAGNYDIIHLAMHTLLNDRDPMNSTLIFSEGKDTINDRYLKTYEVYGIPLKADMVVLSSCNTGAGQLYSGEGIMSLARGFIYSGSKSVVMSMWEIEDRSGTEIVKKFYDYLLKGNSKSVALRKARMAYLGEADQLRSHPYFWSSLVIYGNNKPLYLPKPWIIVILLSAVAALSYVIYSSRPRYSR